jgi:hypothetical protein
MFPSVQSGFRAFNTPFEGCIPYMYLDIKGLVTVAVGNLVDPVTLAQALPFRFKNKPGIAAPGSAATPDQIAAEWRTLKSNPSLGTRGYQACEPITQLELDDDSIDALILNRLASNEAFLKRQTPFQNFDTWPADAQLGLLSMAWAMGPAGPGGFPHFSAACQNSNFNGAAAECGMNEAGNPGLHPRNLANVILFSNAAIVLAGEAKGFQRSNLYYPQALTATGPTG